MQQINITGNLTKGGGARMCFMFEEAKGRILGFPKRKVKTLLFYLVLIKYYYRMTQYNTLNVKLSNSKFNQLKICNKITKVT